MPASGYPPFRGGSGGSLPPPPPPPPSSSDQPPFDEGWSDWSRLSSGGGGGGEVQPPHDPNQYFNTVLMDRLHTHLDLEQHLALLMYEQDGSPWNPTLCLNEAGLARLILHLQKMLGQMRRTPQKYPHKPAF